LIPESRSICAAYCSGLIFLAPAPGVIAFGVLINLYHKVVELGAGSESHGRHRRLRHGICNRHVPNQQLRYRFRYARWHLDVAYFPQGSRNALTAMSTFAVSVTARWLYPTNESYTNIETFSNTGLHNFSPSGNNAGGDPDWVLVLTA
jgi:hypothetical protein